MKVICVPIDLAAEERLHFDTCKESDLVELYLSEEKFELLDGIGLFQSINAIAHSNIDNFEDEVIRDEESLQLIINSDLLNPNRYSMNILHEIVSIKELFIEALKRRTGVYFFF